MLLVMQGLGKLLSAAAQLGVCVPATMPPLLLLSGGPTPWSVEDVDVLLLVPERRFGMARCP